MFCLASGSEILPCGVVYQKHFGSKCIKPDLTDCEKRTDAQTVSNILSKRDAALNEPYNIRIKYALEYHTNSQGDPMTFNNCHYLIAPYQDFSPHQVYQKATQTGETERDVVDLFVKAIEFNLSSLMVFENENPQRNDFVDTRVSPVISRSSFYSEALKNSGVEVDKKSVKHLGQAFLYFYGSNRPFKSFSVAHILFDEFDQLTEDTLPSALSRQGWIDQELRSSTKVSNPTIPSHGIALEYEKSDQKVYMLKCSHCGKWNDLDFFKHVCRQTDNEGYQYDLLDLAWEKTSGRDIHAFCEKCSKPLNRIITERLHEKPMAQWVKQNSSSDVSGYYVSKLYNPKTKLYALWDKLKSSVYNEAKMTTFINDEIGKPYSPRGSNISEDLLDSLCREYIMPNRATREVFAGIDVQPPNLRVVALELMPDGFLRAVYIGSLLWSELETVLISRFNCTCYVMDLKPEVTNAKYWQNKFNEESACQVWLCQYATHEMLDEKIKSNDVYKLLTVDDTQTLDDTLTWLLKGQLILPKNARDLPIDTLHKDEKFFYQMTKSCRVPKARKDRFGEETVRYKWLGKPNDYFHCLNYARLAVEIMHQEITTKFDPIHPITTEKIELSEPEKQESPQYDPHHRGLFFWH